MLAGRLIRHALPSVPVCSSNVAQFHKSVGKSLHVVWAVS